MSLPTVIPVCCVCKRTRQADGAWEWVEYCKADGNISHTYCSECAEMMHPDICAKVKERKACHI